MNVKQLIVGLFKANAGKTELEAVRESGVADGRLAATAYVDGFLDEAGKVFQERMSAFQETAILNIPAAEPSAKPAKSLTKKK